MIVFPADLPRGGVCVQTALGSVGKPRVLVPTDDFTVGNLTVTGTIDASGGDFLEAVIDGGVANSVYCDGFDLDGGSA